MKKIELIPYKSHFLESYQDFAKRNWGQETYKASKNYLNWLYKENPSTNKNESDFMVAVIEGEKVVGCIHKMHVFWEIQGKEIEIPAIHNLLVDEKYQAGYGLFLVTAALKGHEHIFVPAVLDPVSEIYEKMHCQSIPVKWYRKVLNPVSTALRFFTKKIVKKRIYFDESWHTNDAIKSTTRPNFEVLAKVVKTLKKRKASFAIKPSWDEVWLKWRCFHKLGPQHLLVYSEAKDDVDFLILSLGPRHGFSTCRIIEASVPDGQKLKAMLLKVEKLLKKKGVQIFTGYSADPVLNENLIKTGWQPLKKHPKTFFYHQNKQEFTNYAFNAEVGDFGLEAIRI